jgi:hypothetical protein
MKSRLFENIYNLALKEGNVPHPDLLTRILLKPAAPKNDIGLNTIGINKNLDDFIDAELEKGRGPKEIAEEIFEDDYWGKNFTKDGGTIKDLSTYIFRRSQNFEVAGDGEGGQQLLFQLDNPIR